MLPKNIAIEMEEKSFLFVITISFAILLTIILDCHLMQIWLNFKFKIGEAYKQFNNNLPARAKMYNIDYYKKPNDKRKALSSENIVLDLKLSNNMNYNHWFSEGF